MHGRRFRRKGRLLSRDRLLIDSIFSDFRFDLPATGEGTIATLAAVKGAVLAVEAGQSLIFDREAMIRAADRAGIVVIGLCEDDQGTLHS